MFLSLFAWTLVCGYEHVPLHKNHQPQKCGSCFMSSPKCPKVWMCSNGAYLLLAARDIKVARPIYGVELFDGETARFEVELSEDKVHSQWKLKGEVLTASAVSKESTSLFFNDKINSDCSITIRV